jgi:hypothetical protein
LKASSENQAEPQEKQQNEPAEGLAWEFELRDPKKYAERIKSWLVYA